MDVHGGRQPRLGQASPCGTAAAPADRYDVARPHTGLALSNLNPLCGWDRLDCALVVWYPIPSHRTRLIKASRLSSCAESTSAPG